MDVLLVGEYKTKINSMQEESINEFVNKILKIIK